jgi:predicted membrane channel-forming protein YqfA (hemolysin III family)
VIQFLIFLALFAGAALLKGRIPGLAGTYSPVFFLVFLGCGVLSFSEVVLAAGLAGVVQCLFLVQRRPKPLQMAFNAANMMISTACAFVCIRGEVPGFAQQPLLIRLILGAAIYYLVNTGLVALVLTLVDRKPLSEVWRNWCLASLLYYILGASIAGATLSVQSQVSLLGIAMVCPSILLITFYYRYWLKSLSWENT